MRDRFLLSKSARHSVWLGKGRLMTNPPFHKSAPPRLEDWADFNAVITYGYELTYVTEKNRLETELRNRFFTDIYCPRDDSEHKISVFAMSHGMGLAKSWEFKAAAKQPCSRKFAARSILKNSLFSSSISGFSFHTILGASQQPIGGRS